MDEVSLSNGHLSQDPSLVLCLKDCGWHRNGGNRNGQTININNGKTKKKKKKRKDQVENQCSSSFGLSENPMWFLNPSH